MAAAADDAAKRSLIVDEAAFEEQFLRCHICNEKFNQEERHPKSLPCNHTFCLPCLKQVFDHNQQNQRRSVAWLDDNYEGVLKCPECRVEIFVSRSEISALPSDHRVIQMMDFLSQVVAKSQNVCSKHDSQPLNFFCKKCLVPVCRDCTVLDHKEPQGHNIVDVTEALKESSNEFDEIDTKGKDLLDKMKGRTDSLANASKQLDLLERQLRSTIKDTFIEYRLMLEKRQEAMIKILREVNQEQKQKINTRFVDICTNGSKLQKLYDKFKKARACNDIRQLFTIQQEMKEHETEFTCTAEANDDELFVACKFLNPNECTFLSEMSGLGEITSEQDMDLKNPVPAHQLVLLDSVDRQQQMLLLQDIQDDEDDNQTEEVNETSDVSSSSTRGIRSSSSSSRLPYSSSRGSSRRTLPTTSVLDTDFDVDEYVRPLDAQSERETREALASSYLLRIANRLNESASEMAEALGEVDAETPTTDREAGQTRRSPNGNTRGSTRSGRSSGNVRVVRHPTPSSSHGSYTSSRYGSSNNNDSR